MKFATLLLCMQAVVPPLESQQELRVPSEPACRGCRITLQPVARLGSPDDAVSLVTTSRVAVDSRGRYFVAPTYAPSQIAQFDSRGRFQGSIGRQGEGPGEFTRINAILVGPADTLHVFDGVRHTTLVSNAERFVQLRNLPFPSRDRVYLRGHGLVLQYMDAGEGGVQQPLHLIDSSGRVIRSFGGDGTPLSRAEVYESVRTIAEGSQGRIWSAHVNRYRVELWTIDGRNPLNVTRDARWFRPWSGYLPGEPLQERPRPVVAGLREDEAGRLWVLLTVASTGWSPSRSGGESRVWDYDYSEIFDSVLEVIDLQQRRVVARARFDRAMAGFIGDGLLYGSRFDDGGNTVIDVWRARLEIP